MTAYRQYELDHARCMWCHLPHQSCICTAESLAEMDAELEQKAPFTCCRGPFSDLDEAGQRDMMRLCYATTGGCSVKNKPESFDDWADGMSRMELEDETRRARGDEFV